MEYGGSDRRASPAAGSSAADRIERIARGLLALALLAAVAWAWAGPGS
ncbi:hypothetical protein [Lysobacter sp. A3-1-A15]